MSLMIETLAYNNLLLLNHITVILLLIIAPLANVAQPSFCFISP